MYKRPALLIWMLTLGVLSAIAVFTVWQIQEDKRETMLRAAQTANMAAEAMREHTVEAFLDATSPMWVVTQTIRHEGGMDRLSPQRIHEILKLQTPPGTPLDRLFVADRHRDVIADSVMPHPPGGKFKYRNEPTLARHMQEDTGNRLLIADPTPLPADLPVLAPMKTPGSSTWTIPMTRALRDPSGQPEGAIGALFRVDYFKDFYRVVSQHRDASIALRRYDGVLLARYPFVVKALGTNEARMMDALETMKKRGELPVCLSPADNVERLFAWREIPALGLKVHVGFSTREILAPWRGRITQRLAIASASSIAILVLSALLAHKLRALTESENRYRILFESATVGILLVEGQRVVDCNPVAATLFEAKEPQDLQGENLARLIGPSQAQFIARYAANVEESPEQVEWQLQTRAGAPFWVSVSLSAFEILRRSYILVLLRDISPHKHAEAQREALNQELEARVQSRTEQLAQANADLEAFNYSASHDLRAPLRRIRSFIEMLNMEYGQSLPEDVTRLLARVAANAGEMDNMMNNLLLLFTTNQSPLQPQPLDLGKMAKTIVGDLALDHPERKYELELSGDLTAYGDAGLLSLALNNLIGNAWKFSADKPMARIAVGREGEAYFVRDNGVGFDMRFAEKLFVAFQRLHNGKRFEGNGIGLAIVKRVVERHAGRVWVKSAPGEGTTFYFTLGTPDAIAKLGNTR